MSVEANQPELISCPSPGCEILSSHLTEVLGSEAIIIAAGQLVHKGQHLVFGSDEL